MEPTSEGVGTPTSEAPETSAVLSGEHEFQYPTSEPKGVRADRYAEIRNNLNAIYDATIEHDHGIATLAERCLNELKLFTEPLPNPLSPQNEPKSVPRDIAHDLWYQGGRLQIELKGSLELNPENWHEEGMKQRMEEWDKAARSYFDYALATPKVVDSKEEPHYVGCECNTCKMKRTAPKVEEQDGEQELPARPGLLSGDQIDLSQPLYDGSEMDAYVDALEARLAALRELKAKSVDSLSPKSWTWYIEALTKSYPENPTAIAVAKEVYSMFTNVQRKSDSLSPSDPTREQKFKVLDILTKVEEYALPKPYRHRNAWDIVSFLRKQADALIAELEASNPLAKGSPSEPVERTPEDEVNTLVDQFSRALKEKLAHSEVKYGWQNGWMKTDWRDDLLRDLRLHVEKGDPTDVAAYCAFAWHHGWSLAKVGSPSEEGTGWISVQQEMPPDGDPVIIVWSRVVQHLTYTRFEGEWYPYHEDPDDYAAMDSSGMVTHWQPLPAPPVAPPIEEK